MLEYLIRCLAPYAQDNKNYKQITSNNPAIVSNSNKRSAKKAQIKQ